jgi:adenylate cyclase
MADVFVSYARPDEPHAVRVAEALRREGYQVWRDDELPAHRAYGDVIEERLKAAKAVVVLWSTEAAKSQWVRAEADVARSAGTLVQGVLDATMPPLPFNQIQCADLRDFDGNAESAGWTKMVASVRALAPAGNEPKQPARRSRREVSVCVLPFANMSGDAEQEYFSDGISEDITTDLSQISALGVTARNTAFTFKGQSVDVCAVAEKLGVTHVLEGSVRKAGSRVRITAQLIDGATGDHVWADRYDRDLNDIFAIQDEISKAIVDALKLKLLPEEKKAIEQRGTTSAEAYNLYLMARKYWITGNHGDIRREQRVMRICGRAVEIDPYYARAWALLALAQSSMRYGFGCEVDDGFAAAHTALSIDPSIAEAYCAMALRLEHSQRLDEAEAEIAKALQLDPDCWEVNKEAARLCMLRRKIPEATRHYEKAVEVMENDYHAWAILVSCYQAGGNREGVLRGARMMVAQAEKAVAEDPSNGSAIGVGAGGLALLGETDRAREWIERAMLVDPDNLNMRYNFACILAAYIDDKEGALKLLARTFAAASGPQAVRAAQTDPDLDPLREDPRFQKMMADAARRLGIDNETPQISAVSS